MNKVYPLLYLLFLLLFCGCTSTKINQDLLDNNSLRLSIEALVKCINEEDVDCLGQLYADDFESFSPVMKAIDVDELVKKTVTNLAKNNYKIGINIHEIRQGQSLGYVSLNWRILELQDGQYKNLMDEKRLDIWKKNKKGKWQLYRSLFYKENMF